MDERQISTCVALCSITSALLVGAWLRPDFMPTRPPAMTEGNAALPGLLASAASRAEPKQDEPAIKTSQSARVPARATDE
ncbi:MAG TPA: hypothetical protein VM598_10875 [Bdellovibrionota bacterium]|nr:hypothetical protein [Bdellovibrionota bacterium]